MASLQIEQMDELEFGHTQWKPIDRREVGHNVTDAWRDILFERYLIKVNNLKLIRIRLGLPICKSYWNRIELALTTPVLQQSDYDMDKSILMDKEESAI